MNPQKFGSAPSINIMKELENIQQRIAPLLKKSSIFVLTSIPLITFSLINLYLLLFQIGINQELVIVAVAMSLVGAIGFALFKESMHHNKEIHKVSYEYISERISKSDILPELSKGKYLERIHHDPKRALNIFYDFLQHEEKTKNSKNDSTSR
ncbi:hypothetical protein SAMN05421736_107181 [Evansella caseinilytica]|uniref:Uncharacterized protein n=1 Tax=Evansella caseinilytica TaxID=1503961 RepID=A0A1H3R393_9BACI|nr:hypothetical protein SAMN05421736_107181 [Evansella caseinilytica]